MKTTGTRAFGDPVWVTDKLAIGINSKFHRRIPDDELIRRRHKAHTLEQKREIVRLIEEEGLSHRLVAK
mgnify:CR=1 FL=1